MTDFMEITEAFHQARTAPDALERAFGLEAEVREGVRIAVGFDWQSARRAAL